MKINFGVTLLFFLFSLCFTESKAQITYPINGDYGGLPIETCSGYFVDSGEDTLTVYEPGEDYTITFCSNDEVDNELIRFSFDFFDLAEGDTLYVYDGEDDTAPLLYSAENDDLHGEEIWFSSACAYFRFVSAEDSPGAPGWFATINCYTFCDGLWVEAETTTGSFDYCPYDANVDLIANAGYNAENAVYDPENFLFNWNFQGETQSGEQADVSYEEPGAYTFTLSVEDTENACEVSHTHVIRVGTNPVFSGSILNPDTICAKSQTVLTGVATPTTWTGFPTSVEGVFPIPDGTGESFDSFLDFDVFEPLTELEEELQFDKVCINMEHVDYGQLRIELSCPNGNSILLTDFSEGGANLGEPVVWDNTTPGKGYDYCFSPSASYGTMEETSPQYHEYTDNAGNFYFNAEYLPSGTYTPVESFSNLVGCPLNGEWTISVADNATGDNGFIFEWSLFFIEDIYPDSLIFTPEIVEMNWYDEDQPLDDNPVSVMKEEEGEYTFVFEVEDDFSCVFDTTLVLEVLPLPDAEIISELELPVCEGDSTLLSVSPIDDDPLHWIYQWEMNFVELPESIYDTIMAKEPGNYTVIVTDTITGCSNYLDIEVTEQNCDLTIPNIFTPNGDGINDYFEITNLEHYPQSKIVIFNRNGKKIFEHNDYNENWWDGNGVPDGVYFYVLKYERMDKERQIHGSITILR